MTRHANSFPQFEAKVAVVTGAASGIGREMVAQLCASGAQVIAVDRDGERLEEAGTTIRSQGGKVEWRVLDVEDTDALRSLIDWVVEKYGRIDYMINNAGIAGRSGEIRDLVPADWESIVRVNLLAVIHGATFAYRHMVRQGSGHIVNMASAAGLLGTAGMSPYGTTKAGVVEFSRDLRVEGADLGVRVTVLCPGFIESRIFENAVLDGRDPAAVKAAIPFKFLPTDVAVHTMLSAVLANRAVVTLPAYAGILWFLRRLMPVLLDRLTGRKALGPGHARRRPSSLG